MKKSIPYVLAGIGVVVIAFSFSAVRTFLKIPIPAVKNLDLILMIAGAVLVALGAFLLSKSGKPEQPQEIPIYEGTGKERKIVGLQRVHKK